MTIKELKELLEEQGREYVNMEVYSYLFSNHSIHTDSIKSVEEYSDDDEVIDYELMNEEDYQRTILANSCDIADFAEWYDDANAIVLIVIIDEKL